MTLEEDHSKSQVQLWYPAHKPAAGMGHTAHYVPTQDELGILRARQFEGQPTCVFDQWSDIHTAAREAASPASPTARFPLVVIAPGLGIPRLMYSAYAQQLASDGYVVASFDFEDGGFFVSSGKLTSTIPRDDDAAYAETIRDWAKHMSAFLDAVESRQTSRERTDSDVLARIDLARLAAVGHSIGGAAVLEACRTDKRIKACVDLDGAPFGQVASEGILARTLWLRSHPKYSDADLAQLHRSRADWLTMGEKIIAGVKQLLGKPGGDAWVISIDETTHMSFSDAPFTMPADVTHFGGTFLDPSRLLAVTIQILEDYFQWSFGAHQSFPSHPLAPEANVQVTRRESRP